MFRSESIKKVLQEMDRVRDAYLAKFFRGGGCTRAETEKYNRQIEDLRRKRDDLRKVTQ